jgi:aminoglycoside 6'-N-acetyltransferase
VWLTGSGSSSVEPAAASGKLERVSITFRPLSAGDLPKVAEWLAAPHVKEWWPEPHDLASVESRFLPMVRGIDPTEGFIILHDGTPIGYIQRYRLADEPDWRRAVEVAVGVLEGVGIDYLIGDAARVGRGLGTEAIGRFVSELWERSEDIAVVVVAVQQLNLASWHALERAGFERVWAGLLDTDDPSDQGPAFLYRQTRPSP